MNPESCLAFDWTDRRKPQKICQFLAEPGNTKGNMGEIRIRLYINIRQVCTVTTNT